MLWYSALNCLLITFEACYSNMFLDSLVNILVVLLVLWIGRDCSLVPHYLFGPIWFTLNTQCCVSTKRNFVLERWNEIMLFSQEKNIFYQPCKTIWTVNNSFNHIQWSLSVSDNSYNFINIFIKLTTTRNYYYYYYY